MQPKWEILPSYFDELEKERHLFCRTISLLNVKEKNISKFTGKEYTSINYNLDTNYLKNSKNVEKMLSTNAVQWTLP